MKSLLIIALIFTFSSTEILAQKESRTKANMPSIQQTKGSSVKVCQLKMFYDKEGKTSIIPDFGTMDDLNDVQIKEIKTEVYTKQFGNMVDALRYMEKRKWRLVEQYDIGESKNKITYFIMNRR